MNGGAIRPVFGAAALPLSFLLFSPASLSDGDDSGAGGGATVEGLRVFPARLVQAPPGDNLELLHGGGGEVGGCLLCPPAGLPVLLAAPLAHRGLVEVADQGSEPGSVAEG